jgi:zinc protease
MARHPYFRLLYDVTFQDSPRLRISQVPLRALEFHKTTLSNGLDVIIRRQDQVPLVAVNLWYHVGSKNEERSQRGYAHLFEHLMFEGSEHFPGDFFKPLQRLGASVNGSTSSDRTNYFEDLPAAHLELAVAMESDRMGFLLPTLSDDKINVQKGVVTNEYRQNYANRPYGQVHRLFAEALYPPSHPYSWTTIGAMEDVAAATKADLDSFFSRFYVPSNASLCIVGDLDDDHTFKLADRYFGTIPGGTKAIPVQAPQPRLDRDLEILLRERVELDRGYLAWHTVPQFHDDDAPLSILADLLARGRSSRLYRKLVLDTGLAQDVSAYNWSRELAGSFSVVVTMRPGRPWSEARDLIEAEISALASNVLHAELERARTGRVGAFVYALDNIGGFGGIADRMNAYNVYLRDPGRVTSDVQAVASRYLTRPAHKRVELLVQGHGSTRTVADPPVNRSVAPRPNILSRFQPPIPDQRLLACGAHLWAFPRRDLPIISGSLVLRAGAQAHGPQHGGLASLTASMLDEGTTTRSVLQLAEAAESMATSISSNCGWDGSYIGLRCLAEKLEPSLDLAVDVLLNPIFPAAEFERVRAQTLAQLHAEHDKAESRAYRAFLDRLYAKHHPYRLPTNGAIESVERLSRDDLVQFHLNQYRPDHACWIVAGDFDPSQLADLLDCRLEGWTRHSIAPQSSVEKADAMPRDPQSDSAGRLRIVLDHRAGATQAAIRIGEVGIDRLDPDYLNLLLFNQVYGGQFTSRLNSVLREHKGITYGIRSSFDARRGPGPFAVAASVQMDRVAEAVADVIAEAKAILAERPPTPSEIEDARQALIEGQARQFESPSDLVSRFASLFVHQLPIDDDRTLRDRLLRVDADSAIDAARRRLHPDHWLVVVVADADQVADSLRSVPGAEIDVYQTRQL